MTRKTPAAQPHGELRELFDDVFFVSGAVRLGAPLPMTLSRNMTVVRTGESLTLVNSMRLDDAGLKALDALGKVEHVIRLATFHGMDDAFYKERYGAEVWAVEGSAYFSNFDAKVSAADGYFQPDHWMRADTRLPIPETRLYVFETSTPAEGLLLLEREGGILVSGDALQHMPRADEFMNLTAKIVMKLMKFFKPYNIGPGWLSTCKPEPREIHDVLDLPFEHVLPVHGLEVIDGAKEKFRPAIERIG